MEKRVVTIRDVAREAGVSVPTASRALAEYGYVKRETRKKVLETARILGYQYNLVAKSLRTNKTQTIGYFLPDITNPFYAGIARGIQDFAFARGYNVIICNNDNDILKTQQLFKMFIRNRVEGIIYSVPFNEALQEMVEIVRNNGIPIVNCYGSTRANASDVVTGNVSEGCYRATKYLLELGHRNIAFLKVRGSGINARRLEGCVKAFEEFRLELNPDLIIEAEDFTQQSGYLNSKIMFLQSRRPSALFAFNERLAMGVLKAAKEMGISIPRELSLIGVDDIMAELLEPSLTSLAIPTYEAGKTAASLLFNRIEKKKNDQPTRHMFVDELLRIRASTGQAALDLIQ
ncbi:MAG TPA: LacI family DNA-binding transcriptional regulator [Atribacteraceae bacterium]|nr:LacI family DNA-binding transcriptional regulator [Atribacteraceae bacterium]